MITPKDTQYRKGIAFPYVWKLLAILFTLALSPFWASALLIGIYSEKRSMIELGISLLICIAVASVWFARITAHKMEFEGYTFKLAFQHTIYHVLGVLSFLPWVGSFFERLIVGKKPKNPFTNLEG